MNRGSCALYGHRSGCSGGNFSRRATQASGQTSSLAARAQAALLKLKVTNEKLLASWDNQTYQWLSSDRLQMTRLHRLLVVRGCPPS